MMSSGGHESQEPSTGAPRVDDALEPVPNVDWTLELGGSGLQRPATFTYAQLARMEQALLNGILQEMSHFPDKTTSWRGPAMCALLTAAGIKPGLMMITLEASDGYRISCTTKDLERAIVALQDGEGRWLAEVKSGRPLQLVAPLKTGDYWVRNLKRVTLEPLVDVEADEGSSSAAASGKIPQSDRPRSG